MHPARVIVTRSPHRTVGVVHVPWLQPEPIEHESFLERRFVDLSIPCPAVTAIRHQAFRVDYTDVDRISRTYVPDFVLSMLGGGRLVVEVKPKVFVEKNRAKFDAVCEVLGSRGMPFYVLTDDQLPVDAAEEARTWRRCARSAPDAEAVDRVTRAAQVAEGVTLDELLRDGSLAVIYHLLGRRRIVGVNGRFASNSQTRLRTFPNEEPFDAFVCFDTWFGCSPWRAHLEPAASPP